MPAKIQPRTCGKPSLRIKSPKSFVVIKITAIENTVYKELLITCSRPDFSGYANYFRLFESDCKEICKYAVDFGRDLLKNLMPNGINSRARKKMLEIYGELLYT